MTIFLFFCFIFFCFSINHGFCDKYHSEKVKELEQKQKLLQEGIKTQIRKNEELLREIENRKVNGKRAGVCHGNPQVGFNVRLTTGSTTQSSGNILFNSVQTDTSHSYNKSNGVFTIPYNGYYEFFLTLMSQSGNYFGARVVAGGNELCRALASSNSQAMGACVTMKYLTNGTEVSVQPYSGSKLYGGGYTSFSGHIINF